MNKAIAIPCNYWYSRFLNVIKKLVYMIMGLLNKRAMIATFLYCIACANSAFSLPIKSQSYDLPELDGNFMVWQQQCSKKNYEVCYLLGVAYLEGYQVFPNLQKAQKFLTLACKKGVADSCIALSYTDITNNLNNFEVYKEICNFSNAQGCKKLAEFLAINTPQNYSLEQKEKILELLQKSCKLQLDPDCLKMLTTFASKLSDLDKKDEKFEIMNFQNALNTCNSIEEFLSYLPLQRIRPYKLQSCIQVAKMYANGDGVTKNKDFAKRYFTIACQYDTQSCYDKTLDSLLNP